jgi:plastocyanin
VVWRWVRGRHSVTIDGSFDSGEKSAGTYSRTFNDPGTYNYYCTVHGPSMSGTITVN